ncbi:MAG: hypothetical protein AB3N23_20830 [Paracoccaceae bacterium]
MGWLGDLRLWLHIRLPGNQPKGEDCRFSEQVKLTFAGTRIYEGAVSSADQAARNGSRMFVPDIPYHGWVFDWQGTRYAVQQRDEAKRYRFRDSQTCPGWVDPSDLSSVWLLGGVHKCRPSDNAGARS